MVVVTKVKQPGQNTTSTLDGKIRIEDGNGRIIVNDGDVYRFLIGPDPRGKFVIALTKDNKDLFEAYE